MTGNESSTGGSDKGSNRGFLIRYAVIVGAFVLALVALGYLNTRLEDIEDQLKFRAPATAPLAGQATLPEKVASGQMIYVPVYSHVYSRGGQVFPMESTLSIHNTDPYAAITLTSVRYHNTKGKLVEEYLKSPLRLTSLETTEFLVKKGDLRGGSGANFIVEWVAESVVNEPIVEAVMVAISDKHSLSLVTKGRALHDTERPAAQE